MVGIETSNLSVACGGTTILSDISVSLPAGSLTALVGPNGAGKSTLLRGIAGLQDVTGTVRLDGIEASSSVLRDRVAYMPQDTSAASSLSVLEVVLLGSLRSLGLRIPDELIAEAEAALHRLGVGHLAGRTLDVISGGQRQLVYLAQALFRRPGVLLLDEPTAALDLRYQLMVLEIVRNTARQQQIPVVVAMHDLSLAARFADQFVMLADGAVEAAGSGVMVLRPERLARVYGVEADVSVGSDGVPSVAALRALTM